MAIRCSSIPGVIPSCHAEKIAPRMCSVQNGSHVQPTGVRIKSYPVINKVFEDRSNGIICYTDETGELISEGYDEGPRICDQPSQHTRHKRNLKMPNCTTPRRPESSEAAHSSASSPKRQSC